MTGPVNAYAQNSLYMATAWNPADVASGLYPPFPGTFSNSNRTLARNTLSGTNYDPGCRGTLSRGAPGQKWWLCFQVDSFGTANPAGLSFGLLYGGTLTGCDMVKNTGTYLIVFGNGSVYMTGQVSAGTLGAALVPTDVLGMAWTFGVGVDIYVNGNTVATLSVPIADTDPWFPFFGAGATLLLGADPTHTGEQVTLQGAAVLQTYSPPAGFTPWG